MRRKVQYERRIFAIVSTILFAFSCSDIEQRLLSGTGKTIIILNLDPGLSIRTWLQLGIIVLLLGLENFSLVVGLSGIAPVPTRSVKIVPVCVLDDFAAL
jgi:hypothetical protein